MKQTTFAFCGKLVKQPHIKGDYYENFHTPGIITIEIEYPFADSKGKFKHEQIDVLIPDNANALTNFAKEGSLVCVKGDICTGDYKYVANKFYILD